MFEFSWSPGATRATRRCILLCALIIMLFSEGSRGTAVQIPVASFTAVDNSFKPIAVLRRFPLAILHTSKASIESFLQTAGVMVPAGMIWKLGILKSSGMKPWMMEGGKMGVEWGRFSGLYSGGVTFFARMRGVEDKWNSYIACGICSAASKTNDGYRAMAQEFATGFAFVYALEQLTSRMGDGNIEGRQAIEGAVGSKASGSRNLKSKSFTAKGKNSKMGNLPKKKF